MKKICILLLVVMAASKSSFAQQRIEPGLMNYIVGAKPNNIIYRDTLYKGSAQFMRLFARTRDEELMRLYRKHQSNKITGQALGLVGTVAIIVGVGQISRDNSSVGWGLVGGGFAATLGGGYLTLMGQKNLAMAVTLFNQRYSRASIGIGVSDNAAGLVVKF